MMDLLSNYTIVDPLGFILVMGLAGLFLVPWMLGAMINHEETGRPIPPAPWIITAAIFAMCLWSFGGSR